MFFSIVMLKLSIANITLIYECPGEFAFSSSQTIFPYLCVCVCVCVCCFTTYSVTFFIFCLFVNSWATPPAYGGSQARGLIGTVAASLRQSHSNMESEPCLRPTPQLTATLDP